MFLICSATASMCQACNIPVFRYALERWESDDYQVIIFANGAIDFESNNPMARALRQSDCNANYSYSDLTHQDSPHRAVLQKTGGRPTDDHPYYVVLGPHQPGGSPIALHGVLNSDSPSVVTKSPIRQELSRRLLAGHAIVWLILQSPDQDRNQAVSQRVRKAVAAIEKEIDLPEGIGLPGSELHSEVPLLLEFSLLEIKHDDRREALLRQQLGGSQDDPVVVPVFGRGRALEAIPAADLSDSLIKDLTVYLCGACSCQVKERNPGFDLLLDVDWERELFGGDRPPVASQRLRAGSATSSDKPQLLTIPPGKLTKP